MAYLRHTVLAIAIASLSFGAAAQTKTEHNQHHPAAATSTGKSAKTGSAATAKNMDKEMMASMDTRMKAMQDMHDKVMGAKTPEERNALMADHLKAMQDGMAMMGNMGDMKGMGSGAGKKGGMPMDADAHHQMMEKRMEMMTTMMQMMMDRLPPALGK